MRSDILTDPRHVIVNTPLLQKRLNNTNVQHLLKIILSSFNLYKFTYKFF